MPPKKQDIRWPVGDPRSYHAATETIRIKDGDAAAFAFVHAVEENIKPHLRKDLAPILAATRQQENARKGLQFGVISPRAIDTKYKSTDPRLNTMFRTQAGWSAATLAKNWKRHTKTYGPSTTENFIEHYSKIYAPIGVSNDPTGLNKHWRGNVSKFTQRINKEQKKYMRNLKWSDYNAK